MASNTDRFDVADDVETLREALRNSNKDAFINILCARNLEQRKQIVAKFNQTETTPTLDEQIKSHFDGDFQKIMLTQITINAIEYYADELHTAFDNLQTEFLNIFNTFARSKYNIIASILCPLPNHAINELKSLYEIRYGRNLVTDINENLSLHLKQLLVDICNADRDETDTTSLDVAKDEAQQLLDAPNPYDDNQVTIFIEIFAKRNFHQLNLLVEEFRKLTGKPIETHIQAIFKQEDWMGYKTIVEYSEEKDFYYARCLFEALDSGNSTLIGLVLLQCDDLISVKRSFELNFRNSLREFISAKSSGYYKYALYKLFGETRRNH